MFDRLAKWLGMSTSSEESEPKAAQPSGVGSVASLAPSFAQPVAGNLSHPYHKLLQSVDQHLAAFMARSVVPHRQLEGEDVFNLIRVQVEAVGQENASQLSSFLSEFRAETRRKVIVAAVQRNCGQAVSTEDFVDLNKSFEQAELLEVDAYAAQLSESDHHGFRVTMYGEWTLQRPVPPTSSAPPSAHAHRDGCWIDIDLTDAKGTRSIRVEKFPFIVARQAAENQFGISGTFVSRRHGVLELDATGHFWYVDTSVNGSSIDGVTMTHGQRRAVSGHCRLVLGGEGAREADCPVLNLHVHTPGEVHSVTPIRPSMGPQVQNAGQTPLRPPSAGAVGTPTATPLASLAAARPATCLLAIQDATGSRTIAVTHLPFTIGRDEAADFRIPEANAGVSRKHLVIVAIDSVGARVLNNAADAQRWGTEVDGVELPAECTVPWNARVRLAARYAAAAPVSIQLLPVDRPAP